MDPPQYFKDVKLFLEGKLDDWYCSAGEYYFSVDCDGKFQICSGLPQENFSIFDADRDYFKKMRTIREGRLIRCKKICIANCLYDASYFIKYPFAFFRQVFKS